MNWNASNIDSLRRVFTEGFSARDIAEPLASFDVATAASQARELLAAQDYDIVGIRRDGRVVGYAERADLGEGACETYLKPIEDASVISEAASLTEVVLKLSGTPRLFVRLLGAIGGIITMADLQKPPVRMWLFGMVTLIEMRMGRLIDQLCEGESWMPFISENRLQKAADLLEERRQRSQNLRLIDCLQFSDKMQIIARNAAIRSLTRFSSRREVETACRALENLRNNLAHSQDILSCDWETIVMLSADLDGVIAGTQDVEDALAGRLRGSHAPTADNQ